MDIRRDTGGYYPERDVDMWWDDIYQANSSSNLWEVNLLGLSPTQSRRQSKARPLVSTKPFSSVLRPFADPIGKIMTDLYIVKPVVRLPHRRESVSFRDDKKDDQRSYHGDRQSSESLKPGQYSTTSLAVDKTLYIKDLSRRVSSQNVLDVLKSCDPQRYGVIDIVEALALY